MNEPEALERYVNSFLNEFECSKGLEINLNHVIAAMNEWRTFFFS